jgi:hypothetical protein
MYAAILEMSAGIQRKIEKNSRESLANLTDRMMFRTLNEVLRVVDSLSTGQNLLAAHEHVVGVGIFGVVRVGHGVEGPDGQRELVQDVEVSVILCLHQTTEKLLVWRRQILLIARLNSSFAQHRHRLVELELEWRLEELESVDVELLTDSGNFRRVVVAQSLEHLRESVADRVQHLVVVVLERHLQIQADEFRQVTVSVGIFSAENCADREHAVKVSGDCHLLVELGRLCEIGRLLEVADGEHVGAALTRSRDDLRRVDFDEALTGEDVAEEFADAGFEAEDCLVCWCAEVEHAIVQPGVLVHADVEAVWVVFLFRTRRVFDLEWQLVLGLRHDEDFQTVKLEVLLCARFDLLGDGEDVRLDVDDALAGNPKRITVKPPNFPTNLLLTIPRTSPSASTRRR